MTNSKSTVRSSSKHVAPKNANENACTEELTGKTEGSGSPNSGSSSSSIVYSSFLFFLQKKRDYLRTADKVTVYGN